MKGLFLAILASVLIPTVLSQGQSTFTTGDERHDVLFAVIIPSSNSTSPDDLHFHIEGPRASSWIAFGFGERMKDSLMLIVYSSGKNSSDATISPRIARGNSEPTYHSDLKVEKTKSSIRKGRYSVTGICRNCRALNNTQYVDFASTKQPMIYAVGPNQVELSTGDKGAGLRRHDRYGRFTVDMVQAVAENPDPASFPQEGVSSNNGSAAVGHEKNDHEYGSSAHGLLMILAFTLLFPLGTVWLKVFKKVRWHWINQLFGVTLVFGGAAIGANLSRQYNRSRNYNSPHQVLGFVLLALALIQLGLGAAHHRIFKRQQRRSILASIHIALGSAIISLGFVNGILGFLFACTPRHLIGYLILVFVILILYCYATIVHERRQRRKEVFQTPAARNFQSAYVTPQHQHDIPLSQAGDPPPPYSRPAGS